MQAAIAARIDRLKANAKRTLSAAAVVGTRFTTELITALGIQPVVDELVAAQLIDQVRFTRQPEYVFHHPLIRRVAYESQLMSDRAELHRRLAASIQERNAESLDENAALIAEHLEAAGELPRAYEWHMRAAGWLANRDIAAARRSWERARTIADALPAQDPNRVAMRIAPRTMLCGTAYRGHVNVADARFDELRELCAASGDQVSLAIAMQGLAIDYSYQDRLREASQLASEGWALTESLGDPTLTVALSTSLIYAKIERAEWADVLQRSQTVIDLADGDPSKGNMFLGSPLAVALTGRGAARYWFGRPGWHDDLRHGVSMARSTGDPLCYATVVTWAYFAAIPYGVLTPDDGAVREIEDALRIADRSGDDLALTFTRATLGLALVHRSTDAERVRGQKLLAEVSDTYRRHGHNLCELPLVEVFSERESARRGDRDAAIPLMRTAADHVFREGRLLAWSVPVTGVLVETLLDRGAESDVAEAEAAIERLAKAPSGEGLAVRDIWLLRLRALLARAHGDEVAYRDYRDRYRAMATSLGFKGHMKWAEAMP